MKINQSDLDTTYVLQNNEDENFDGNEYNDEHNLHSKYEKELDEARQAVNEKYDRYTEGLYKRVSEVPIFGVNIAEHLRVSTSINPNEVSPVIRKLIESMIRQNAFEEEVILN